MNKILFKFLATSLLILPLASLLTPPRALAQSGNLFTNPDFTNNNSGWSVGAIVPDGWIEAPGNPNYGLGDFLVMQYEAKGWDTQTNSVVATGGATNHWAGNNTQTRYRAISTPDGLPWRRISQNGPNYDAIEACGHAYQMTDLSSGSTHLITNNEWMTLARDIEAQPSNWADNVIGSTIASGGGLKKGNAGVNNSATYDGANPEGGTGRNPLAMHTLSNGRQIWDLGANVYEWLDTTTQRQDHPVAWNGTVESIGWNWSDYGASLTTRYIQTWKAGGLQQADAGPSNTSWNATHGVGRIFHYSDSTDTTNTVQAMLRGGAWEYFNDSGIYGILLSVAPTDLNIIIGFRCTTNPVEIEQSFSSGTGLSGSNGNEFSVGNVTSGKIFQSINVGNNETYELTTYVYNEGNTIDNSVASMYADENPLTTTYTALGDGWYKLSALVAGDNSLKEYGLILEPGNNLILDNFILAEEGTYSSEGTPINANVPHDLTFNISSNLCTLGILSTSSTNTCTHTMSASTNAAGGYSIRYLPASTLTSVSLDEIDDTGASGATSSNSTKQFGFNLVSNSSPSVGADPLGGVGTVSSDYNTTNIFSFNTSGATVASSTGPSENTTYTASYIANIDGNTPQGEYSTVVTYVITASY